MSEKASTTVVTVVTFLLGFACGVMATNSSDRPLAAALVYSSLAAMALIGAACWFYSLGAKKGAAR